MVKREGLAHIPPLHPHCRTVLSPVLDLLPGDVPEQWGDPDAPKTVRGFGDVPTIPAQVMAALRAPGGATGDSLPKAGDRETEPASALAAVQPTRIPRGEGRSGFVVFPEVSADPKRHMSELWSAASVERGNANDRWVNYSALNDLVIGKAMEWLGIDASNFVHSIDLSAAKHVYLGHGPGNERRRGSAPITDDVLGRLIDVVNAPDSLQMNEHGSTIGLVYRKRVGTHTLVVVEEVRKGRMKLMLKTMYMESPGR